MPNVQYIVDEVDKRQAVILPLVKWQKICTELEELEDIRTYDAAMRQKQESIPFAQAVKEIEEAWRE